MSQHLGDFSPPSLEERWRQQGSMQEQIIRAVAEQAKHEAICGERYRMINEKLKWGFVILGFLLALQIGADKADLLFKMAGIVPGASNVAETVGKLAKPSTPLVK